jgi:Tfp pilus assembly protein PilO
MNSKNTSSIVSLILLVALVAAGMFWFRPNWDDVNALKVTEKARAAEKKTVEDQLAVLQQAQADLTGAGEVEQQTVLTAIPEKFSQDKLITLITEIARKNDVNIGSISFSIPVGSKEVLKKATVNLSMTGNSADLIRLLKGLENSSRKLVVKNITVQYGETEGMERVNFSITLETYFQGGL